MTLQPSELKTEVGVRELHDQLSRYVRHVAAGGEVRVTIHGKQVARLVPVTETDSLAELKARGLIRAASEVAWSPSGKTGSDVTVSDLIAAQRR